jgi:hypothetical protein
MILLNLKWARRCGKENRYYPCWIVKVVGAKGLSIINDSEGTNECQ